MKSVAARSVADDLGIDVNTSPLGVFQALQDQHTSTLANHEAVAIGIERAAGPPRIVVAAGNSTHVAQGSGRQWVHHRFATTTDHNLGSTPADAFRTFPDGVGAGGAGRIQ